SIFGLGILTVAAILAVVYVVMSLMTNPPAGITTVLVLLLLNLGVTSLGIGVLGEYIAKIYAESKRRPLWLVDYTLNLDDAAPDLPGESKPDEAQPPAAAGTIPTRSAIEGF